MPLVSSEYRPKSIFKNGHFATIYSAKLRVAPKIIQQRQRVYLPDDDFIDLDYSYSKKQTQNLVILLHGLEGNAQRTYMRGQANILNENDWDVCAVNYRGCSGEMNKAYQSYNAGKTDDLEQVIHYILVKKKYSKIALVGFSLGGNLLLKYLGEREEVPKEIYSAVAISSPLSLEGSLYKLSQWYNWIYRTSFLYDFRKKYKAKMKQYPEEMTYNKYKSITSLKNFDDIYTAPAHGFKDAMDYYTKNSSLQFISKIKIPVLILNALNDSFLSQKCYPITLADKSKNIYLETPKFGGHVGFYKSDSLYYSEERTLKFLTTKNI